MQVGNILIPAVRTFQPGQISRPIETIPGLGHRGYGLAEFEAELPQVLLEGSLLQLYGNTRTLAQFKEDVEGLSHRGAGYNSVTSVKGRTGWISVESVDVDDETGVLWPVNISGTWFDASQYDSVLSAQPVTVFNVFGLNGSYNIESIRTAPDVRCFDGPVEIFSPFHIFSGNCIIQNGLYQVTLGGNTITVSYWDTDEYVQIDEFAAGTFDGWVLDEINIDVITCRTSNGITISMERGRVPHIRTPVSLTCSTLEPADQTTGNGVVSFPYTFPITFGEGSAINYLEIGAGLYVASNLRIDVESGSISAGDLWIFRAVSGVAETAADCLVKSNLHRQVVRR